MRRCVIPYGGHPLFAKLEVLRDLRLLRDIVGALAPEVDPDVDAVCLLANSGLPFGVFLARRLNKPLYFYRSAGWFAPAAAQPDFVKPTPPRGSRVVLADSHVHEGYTAGKAEEKLAELGVDVAAVVVPFDFDRLHLYPIHAPILSLGRLSEYETVLQAILHSYGFGSRRPAHECLREDRFWRYVPDDSVSFPDDIHDQWAEASLSGVPFLSRKPAISYIDQRLKVKACRHLSGSSHRAWNLFTNPNLVSDAAMAVTRFLGADNYDLLVGTGVVGTALALTLAYSDSFRGHVVTLIPELGFLPTAEMLRDRRVLLCHDSLASAAYLLDVLDVASRLEARVEALLAIQVVGTQASDLISAGVRIFALC